MRWIKASERLWKYGTPTIVKYEGSVSIETAHNITYCLPKDEIEWLDESIPSQGLREEEKSKVKDLIRDAWGASALAHRLYPENKHTFSDYWHTLDKKEFESLFTSTKDNQL